MAFKHREELVGKRFLAVSGTGKLKLSKIAEWSWRAGTVRAASHKDPRHQDLMVLVEFDDSEWERREWIRVYGDRLLQVFLVEKTLVWSLRTGRNVPWPALNFQSLIDHVGVEDHKYKPIEYFLLHSVEFVDYSQLQHYQENEETLCRDNPSLWKELKSWTEFQGGQRILLTTPSVLVGYRVEVYRVEGTTQWYTAVIVSYNPTTKALSLTDDTVLEEHCEDPGLVQMKLIGDGVVESILRGENVGITPRRRACTQQAAPPPSSAPGPQPAPTVSVSRVRHRKHPPRQHTPRITTPSPTPSDTPTTTNNKESPKPPPPPTTPTVVTKPEVTKDEEEDKKDDGREDGGMAHVDDKSTSAGTPVLVYRDPQLVQSSTSKVRHVESVQHRLMAPVYRGRSPYLMPATDYRTPTAALHPSLMGAPTNYVDMLWQQQQQRVPHWAVYTEHGQLRTMADLGQPRPREEQDRHDKERKDKEKEERERVQRDVQLHFDESLRLAQKRHMEKSILNSLSKNPSLGRGSAPPSSRHLVETPPAAEKNKNMDSKERQSHESRMKDQERWFASQLRIEPGHNYSWGPDNRLSVLKREKSPVSPGKVTEPANYSPYGYQPFQHTYMAQTQLKASSPNSQAMTDKRTSQRQDRPTTPGRQKPIKQSFHHERASPVYQPVVGGSGAFKPYEYPSSGPQPAHQNTSSSRYTPSQLDQPQNLVKGEPRPAPPFSPKSAPSPTSATYTHSLIQKGVVPNPLYTSVKDQQYPRATSGSGITSGTPICRPNSVSPQIRQSTYSSAYRSPQPRHSPPSSPHHPPPRISPAPVSPVPDAQPLNLHSIKRKQKDLSTSNKIKKTKMEDTLMPPHLQPQYHPTNIPLSSSLPYSVSPPNSVIHSGANVPSNASEFTPSPSMAEVPSASSPLAAMPTLTNSSELAAMDQVYYSKLDKGRNKLKSVSNHDTPPPTLSQPEEPTSKPAVEHNTISTTSYHTKLKKAWLQRHSENEDKKVETAPPIVKIETPVITKVPPTLEENSSHSLPPIKQEEMPIVNGVDEKTNHEESSSSASEGDRENKSNTKRKIKISSKNWSNKRSRHSETESVSIEEAPVVKKEQEEKKKPKESNSRRKRVRKSKNKHSTNDETNKKKSITVQSPPKALEKPSIAQLKKTGEPFLQDGACYDVAPRLPKCRECRMTPHQRNKKMPNIFCRFYAYRKLKYGKSGAIVNAGFSEPNDASDEDLKLWLPPTKDSLQHNLDVKTSLFILQHIGDYFCNLVLQEKEAVLLSKDKAISWKKVVQGVREQCDVCDTTLFNIHWVCHKCGFVVCIDCYRARKQGTIKEQSLSKDRDEFQWLLCSNRQPHEQDKLMTTQIIAGPSLWLLGQMIHEVRRHWHLPSHCSCIPPPNGINKKLISTVLKCLNSSEKEPVNGVKGGDEGGYSSESGGSPLSWLAEVALKQQEEDGGMAEEEEALRELVAAHAKGVKNLPGLLKHVFFHVIEPKVKSSEGEDKQLRHFSSLREPPRTCSLEESSKLHPDLNHMWLCGGRVLLLNDPQSDANLQLFQEMWSRGQPTLVANVTAHLTPSIWHPDTFIQDFGEVRNDLVNCKTGAIIPDIPMRKFWEGFETLSKRLKDDDGEPAILRLKDWPPGDEFSEVLPAGFKDLMEGLPLRNYILRSGIYNLASRFPDLFARPDLGPRMYISYGSPSGAGSGLQMEICDSVSVLVYVAKEEREDLGSELEEAGCDPMAGRCLDSDSVGALWHIFHSQDADKIRNFLNKVGEERGQQPPAHLYGEPSWYLNDDLRERLRQEEGVECYAIAQCAGDAIFLPAGCPHQVRSLRSCIRVAADFISPENAGLSLQLTQEAPSVLDDKLQIKNLLYHAVKDAVGLLQSSDPDDYFNT